MKIPFASFSLMHSQLRDEINSAFLSVYDSNSFILGENVKFFEEEYSNFNKVKYTIGVSNGLDALSIALRVSGVNAGDEVLVPSNTFIASWLSISMIGAKPIPIEPNIDTYNINVNEIEKSITKKTAAIMPVHLYGQACEMDKILSIANKFNLKIIEDNAQAQGAMFSGCLTGSFGDINATSFYPGKNLGAIGDAGALTTNVELYSDKAKMLRNYGSEVKYQHDLVGFNMRMDELQAAILQVKLRYLEHWIKERKQIASWYDEQLVGIGDLILPKIAQNATSVYHLYVIRTKRRNELQAFLHSYNIGTLVHYPIPPHLQKAYTQFKDFYLPIAEELSKTSLSLPLWIGMTKEQVEYVANVIRKFWVS
jgi:dTDP-4-amino-4,6-dideoxygalactose transaminase